MQMQALVESPLEQQGHVVSPLTTAKNYAVAVAAGNVRFQPGTFRQEVQKISRWEEIWQLIHFLRDVSWPGDFYLYTFRRAIELASDDLNQLNQIAKDGDCPIQLREKILRAA